MYLFHSWLLLRMKANSSQWHQWSLETAPNLSHRIPSLTLFLLCPVDQPPWLLRAPETCALVSLYLSYAQSALPWVMGCLALCLSLGVFSKIFPQKRD